MITKYRDIPTTKREYYYVASDGKEFDDKRECVAYEHTLSLKGIPVIENQIENLTCYWDEGSMTMYNITDENDWNILVERVWFGHQTTKKYPGSGVYLAKWNDGGDNGGWYTVILVENYIADIEQEIESNQRILEEILEARDKIST